MSAHTLLGVGLAAALLATSGQAAAAELDARALLRRGTMVLIEDSGGRFEAATAVGIIDAPRETVWKVLVDFANYKNFMPKVVRSDVVRQDGNSIDVEFELEVPGPNSEYTLRYLLDPSGFEINVQWVDGELKGSRWRWKLEPADGGGKTAVEYRASVKNFSSVVESLEDDQQTMTVGVNVGAVLAATKAIKRTSEKAR